MRKIFILSAAVASLAGLVTVTAPTSAEAQYYGGYSYRPYYAPYYYGGGYYDLRRYGYPGSRDSLNTCAYC